MKTTIHEHPSCMRHGMITLAVIVSTVVLLPACVRSVSKAGAPPTVLEDIYVLRSIREQRKPALPWCSSDRTGFELFAADAERFFSFWSLRSEGGKIVDSKAARVAELRGCFGPTNERARQHFYAEVQLGSTSFHGSGECLALTTDFPETGLFPVRCQLILSGLPAPYVGGLLTTNTLTSKAAFGADTDPPGYTQASIATIRLWKAR